MKLNLEKPVQTRDGRKARIICTDAKFTASTYGQPIVALITTEEGPEVAEHYCKDGLHRDDSNDHHPLDLLNIPEEKELWAVVYEMDRSHINRSLDIYFDKSSATVMNQDNVVARIKVTYKEGQFDD